MTTMDVKGINWVGCVYEKFESMCLEVEENMYQDTVKFVEDQVQTVGESVKKFYADIMQDLLCDSSLDGDNISACGFPIEHYSDVDNSKKSKIRKTKEHVKVGVEEVNGDSEVISVVEKNVEHTGLFHRQRVYDSCTRSSGDCAKVACSDLYSRQDHGMRSYINKIWLSNKLLSRTDCQGQILLLEKILTEYHYHAANFQMKTMTLHVTNQMKL
ncbi:hypothetical protein RchiOBHm_Chr2g0128481 [Rosa chinensis]|uniref:Uncharacterized protein n=1 Tax=Rosa chinensis TaxID=74649 RepID=A0A2P6RUC3_ROSCH|nr:uncharacterized protein LOC112189277 [Rosa chinensis]PRQ50025.1 hypothetical protein RchiOBHm_Chr2g0128481 [Rosa chinensis]